MAGTSGIATPGFCDNAACCTQGARQRIVLVKLGNEFACAECGGMLRHPPHGKPFPVGPVAALAFIVFCAGTGLSFGIGFGQNGLHQMALFHSANAPPVAGAR